MIEFISMLLGLVSGPQPVELSVVGSVAEVELRLDGETMGTLTSPPWKFECEFSDRLAPHELEAIARDSEGQEIDRAIRWINVQQQPVAAAIAFSADSRGHPRAARLVWESLGTRQPQAIEMFFDGQPLPVTDPEHVPLPAYDPEQLHFVSATLRFANDAVSRIEASFGGLIGSEISTGLTGVAVTLDVEAKMPSLEAMQHWFLKDGQPLKVQGFEEGEAEVVIVRDPAVQPLLEELVTQIESRLASAVGRRTSFGALDKKTFLRVLSPAGALLPPTGVTREMFARSTHHDTADAGLLWLTQQIRPQSFPMFFSNAVALAGMQAHASTRRRAVVVLLGPSPMDPQALAASEVRAYLSQMRVPLFVWSLTDDPHPEWGESKAVHLVPDLREGHKRLRRAVAELRVTLDKQRIVWLEGSHLPQNIELAPEASGIRLLESSRATSVQVP